MKLRRGLWADAHGSTDRFGAFLLLQHRRHGAAPIHVEQACAVARFWLGPVSLFRGERASPARTTRGQVQDAADSTVHAMALTAIDETKEVRMIYKVALHRSEEGYSVTVPGLPGCSSQGATESEALENVADAIREYLEVAAELAAEAESREVEVAV